MASELAPRPYPLYNTTFTIYRLSPLFHSNANLNNTTLRNYAVQFRDILTGEVLRGVRVGLAADDEALARVGALKSVQLNLFGDEEDWEAGANETQMTTDDSIVQETNHVGMIAEVTYEKSTYSAILLQDTSRHRQNRTPGFSHYPLLLTRMPGPLRETFLEFLSTSFDTRASTLKLPSQFLAETAETYLANITTSGGVVMDSVAASRSLRTIIKDILVTLSFDVAGTSSALKSMDITISKEDSWRMIARGQKLLQVENKGPNSIGSKTSRPFTKALSQYIDKHMGLQLENPHVKISRVACGAFVLGTEGKVKLSTPAEVEDEENVQQKATKSLVAGLIDLATGGKVVTMIDLS